MKPFGSYVVILTAVMIAAAVMPCRITADDESEARAQINATAASISTMRCDFVQTKHVAMLNDVIVSRGKMCYDCSVRLRWEYVTPYSYLFVINQSRVLIGREGRSDVIDINQSKVFKEIARMMMSSVMGNCIDNDRDFATVITSTAAEWKAILTPKRGSMKQLFSQIVIHFNRQKGIVSKIEMVELGGDRTEIELSNVEINVKIDESVFSID